MKIQRRRLVATIALTIAGASALLTGCGGGGGTPVATSTPLSATVIDGAIMNAVVCLDKNANGACDAGEPQGTTDAAGKVTFDVANDDFGKFPILAIVGTDAVDADTGPVSTAFVLTAPADKPFVVSPLTSLVQQVIASTGVSSDDAARSVSSLTGVTASLFEDYTKAIPPSDGTNPATLARMLVVTIQQQSKAIESEIGKLAADGTTISRADIDRASRKKMLERIPALLSAISDPAVRNAATPAAKEAALLVAAMTLASDDSALKPAGISTEVAINNQIANPIAEVVATPTASATLANLNFTNASNYFVRFFTGTVAQNTPDANNNVKYVDRRSTSASGFLAKWGIGSEPRRQADLSWNGSAWVACPINFEGTSSVRDAQGRSTYNFCDNRETGKGVSVVFDIAGKTMKEVYDSIVATARTNIKIDNSATALGAATFPTDAKLRYSSSTSLTTAISYYPAGKDNPAGISNTVSQYSPAVSAGGIAANQAPGVGCNSNEFNNTNGTTTATLEGMIAAATGNPCVFTGGSFVYQGVTYTNPDPTNEPWFAQSLSIGTLGTAPVGSGPAPGFYTTNTRLRVAFKGSGPNATTYYACKERFNNGSSRNCAPIGTGTYTITTLGDARVMTLNNLPAQMAALTYTRVFVERGGAIYFGFQNKLATFNNARLNTIAGNALLTQLGLPLEDPTVPIALTAGSYQGTYDVSNAGPAHANGAFVTFNADGTSSCKDSVTSAAVTPCAVTMTNAATGAFSATIGASSMTGSVTFLTGIGSGTLSLPDSGNFTVLRR